MGGVRERKKSPPRKEKTRVWPIRLPARASHFFFLFLSPGKAITESAAPRAPPHVTTGSQSPCLHAWHAWRDHPKREDGRGGPTRGLKASARPLLSFRSSASSLPRPPRGRRTLTPSLLTHAHVSYRTSPAAVCTLIPDFFPHLLTRKQEGIDSTRSPPADLLSTLLLLFPRSPRLNHPACPGSSTWTSTSWWTCPTAAA